MVKCPYKGLLPYAEEDAEYFFGRSTERRIITANLRASRLTVLYGESGVGKSSVLNAGVAYDLRDDPDYVAVFFRSWHSDLVAGLSHAIRDSLAPGLPSESLADANAGAGDCRPTDSASDPKVSERRSDGRRAGASQGRDAAGRAESSLADLIQFLEAHTTSTGRHLLVILDQFEEYFQYQPYNDGEGTFAREFHLLLNREDLRVNFLISIREDAIASLDHFKGQVPNLLDNRLRIEYLTPEAAKEGILSPIERYNAKFGNGAVKVEMTETLAEKVVREILNAQGDKKGRVQTPYLQLVMTRWWEREMEEGSHVMREQTLTLKLGGVKNIVDKHLDTTIQALTPNEQKGAAKVFGFLVTPAGRKIAYSLSDLVKSTDLDRPIIEEVLEKLRHARVISPIAPPQGSQADEKWYEFAHDVVARAAGDWRRKFQYSQKEQELEEQKRNAEEQARSAKRFRRMAIALALVSVLVLGAAILAWILRQQAQRNERIAKARTEEAQAAKSQALAMRNNFEAYRADLMGAGDEAKKLWSQARNYERESYTLFASAEQKLKKLPAGQPKIAYLAVKSEPESYIFVNDEPKTKVGETGKSNALELKPGTYTIRVVKDEFKTLERSIRLEPLKIPQELELKLTRISFAPEFLDAFLEGKKYWSAPEAWRVEKGKMLVTGPGIGLIKGNIYKDFRLTFDIQLVNRKGALWILRAQDDKNYYIFQLFGPAGDPSNSFRASRYKNGKLELINTVRVNQNLGRRGDWFKITAEGTGNRISHLIESASQPSAEGAQKLAYMQDNSFSYGAIGFGTRDDEEFYFGPTHVIPLKRATD